MIQSIPTMQHNGALLLTGILSCLFCSSCTLSHRITNFSQPDAPRHAGLNRAKAKPQPEKKTIKVISFNIALSKKIDAAIKLLTEDKDLKNADIICLQEMSEDGIKKIAHALDYNYVYYPSAIHPSSKKDFGEALLSPWPLKNDKKILLPHFQKDRFNKMQRTAVAAVAVINGKEILAYSLHLSVMISPQLRKEQAETVLASIPSSASLTIVCGDFNTYAFIHIKPVQEAFAEKGFTLATHYMGTYKHWYLFNRKSALDHIFYKGCSLLRTGKVVDRSASDHFPLWAEFSLP